MTSGIAASTATVAASISAPWRTGFQPPVPSSPRASGTVANTALIRTSVA
ncbi:hypothetical protein [Sphingomonas sp. Sphisp66]